MKRKDFSVMIVIILLFSTVKITFAQGNIEQAIQNVKAHYFKALEVAAGVFAHSDFQKAYDLYNDAEEAIKDKESPEKIIEIINSAIEFFKSSTEIAQAQNSNFPNLMSVRKIVLSINNGKYLPEQFLEAEEEFTNAVEEFNDKDNEGFNKYSILAEKLYKEAELIMIKQKYFEQIKSHIDLAEDKDIEKFAPLTLKKCKQLVLDAENIINANRYDTLNAKSKLQQATYELNHGLYLKDSFTKMDIEDKTLEDLVLFWEEPIANIAKELNLPPEFHNGPVDISLKIIKNINESKSKLAKAEELNNKLNSTITENNKQLKELKQETETHKTQIQKITAELTELKIAHENLTKNYDEAQSKLSTLEGENIQYKTQSDEMQRNQQLVESISKLFTPSEAEILKSGDNLIIRLINLNFPPNKSSLDPQYFSLLMKVQKAILTFPNGTAVIEGHTDSQGDFQKNLELSQARASAIYQYLLTTMGADAYRISALGLGSSKPVANNNTEEGKSKNRRIEVVISPHF